MSDSFDRQAKAVVAKARSRADQLLAALVIEADRRLREKSPVDTGLFRGNWNISVGEMDTSVHERYEGPGPDRPTRKPGELAPAPPPAVARPIPEVHAGDVVHLVNALPYSERLEYGWSGQAPEGVVRVTAAELEPLARQIVATIRADVQGPVTSWLNSDDPLAKIAKDNAP